MLQPDIIANFYFYKIEENCRQNQNNLQAYYENPSLRVATERRQYLAEINFAKSVGNLNVRKQLIMDYLEEKSILVDRFYTRPYGYLMELK